MERKECEEKILELMKQIKKVADEYCGYSTQLSIAIMKKGSMFVYNSDAHEHGDKPIYVYFSGKKRGEQE